MLFGEEISDFRASLVISRSLSLSLYLISSLDITREFLEWTRDAGDPFGVGDIHRLDSRVRV